MAIGRGSGVDGIIVIPHPVPPGVLALAGPGVRAPHPPGDIPGVSRKWEDEANRDGRCGGGIDIFPISGLDDGLRTFATAGDPGDTGVTGIVFAEPVDPEPPPVVTAGLTGTSRVAGAPLGLLSGSIGFQISFNAARVAAVDAACTSDLRRTAFSSRGTFGSSNTVVPGGNTGLAPVTLANLAELVGGAWGIAEFASELPRPPFPSPAVGLFGDATLVGEF